ncbi:MAG TPA: mercuric reductase [Anaerolineae bacterium]|nr:mercuric reductase [Anaerolineae bacterium]
MTQKYDAIIIGSGQGGNPLAHKLADAGWQVALIEKEYLGGTCVNYGCTPTKTMMASARLAHYARTAPRLGVETGPISVNLQKVIDRKNDIVHQWRQGQQENTASRPSLHLYRGHARFTAPHTIAVNDDLLTSTHIIINTGTRPRTIPLPGLDTIDYLTNRTIMQLTNLPEHLLVLGGSYIGLEFGQMFARFGSRVTIIERAKNIISREDSDVAQTLQDALTNEGLTIHTNSQAKAVTPNGSAGLTLTIDTADGTTHSIIGSHLLLAIGRQPNSDDLGLDKAGIETDSRGYIKTDEFLQTNVDGVWAMGDVKGGPAFTHIAYDDHFTIYQALINQQQRSIANRIIPYGLFTDPELGRVGLSEKEARAQGYKLKIGSIPMSWVARAIERDETAGLMKIVINAENDRILGAAILGAEGAELVQTLMALMMADAPYTIFEKSIYIHPTLTEGFFTLMDNVQPVD